MIYVYRNTCKVWWYQSAIMFNKVKASRVRVGVWVSVRVRVRIMISVSVGTAVHVPR